MSALQASEIDRVFREQYGRAVAVLVRLCGDIDLAQDAVQDAFAAAVQRWPVEGVPPSPVGWIITTARNRAVDRFRREAAREDRHMQAARLREDADLGSVRDIEESVMAVIGDSDSLHDERLRLIFTGCHPALHPEGAASARLARSSRATYSGRTVSKTSRTFRPSSLGVNGFWRNAPVSRSAP
jgi:RNA polymerase sigma-70 factor, ECF subfamily